ncbi:uncharacterized protein LOC129882704 [Solanum dulcamara]|uniref:uncharacterized protein LOC129882704 n=1 Tax=Solanum dulcamara TaxID=45834 RepID=UPI0024859AAB|nr:uncharacterized protein LOC129882704 [Solanum dulcamara]
MSPESRCGPFEHVKLEGRNLGASMMARRGVCSSDCCCINIYINNNIQGVNNSFLFGSKVKMGDPGVSFSMKDVKFHRGKMGTKKIKGGNSPNKRINRIMTLGKVKNEEMLATIWGNWEGSSRYDLKQIIAQA